MWDSILVPLPYSFGISFLLLKVYEDSLHLCHLFCHKEWYKRLQRFLLPSGHQYVQRQHIYGLYKKKKKKETTYESVLKEKNQYILFSKTTLCFHFCNCQNICCTVIKMGYSLWMWSLQGKHNEVFPLTSLEIQ